jgi:hypothetical protein
VRRPRCLYRRTSRSVLISLQVELILQRAGDMSGGYELQRTDAKGEGVFATRSFQVGETVMVGVIEAELATITPMPPSSARNGSCYRAGSSPR